MGLHIAEIAVIAKDVCALVHNSDEGSLKTMLRRLYFDNNDLLRNQQDVARITVAVLFRLKENHDPDGFDNFVQAVLHYDLARFR